MLVSLVLVRLAFMWCSSFGLAVSSANKMVQNGFAGLSHALQRFDKVRHADSPTAAGVSVFSRRLPTSTNVARRLIKIFCYPQAAGRLPHLLGQ